VQSEPEGHLDEKIREELDNAEWDKILPRVLKYAIYRVKKYELLSITCPDPEDLVNEAITLAYGADAKGSYRKWNKERYPGLADFLISIVSSITSHEIDHLIKFRHEYFRSQEEGTQDPLEIEASSVSKILSPEQIMVQEQRAKDIIEEFNRVVEGDEEIELILLCIEEGVTKPREIAKETGYDVKRVYNIMKRMRRKLQRLNTSLVQG